MLSKCFASLENSDAILEVTVIKNKSYVDSVGNGSLFNVTRPTQVVDVEQLLNSLQQYNFEKETIANEQGIVCYFSQLLLRTIIFVDGAIHLSERENCCEYCKTLIPRDNYYYCLECHKEMCVKCKRETNEEIAVLNGAKNYAKRKQMLNTCLTQHTVIDMDVVASRDVYCDCCGGNMKLGFFVMLPDMDNSFDICTDCWNIATDESPATAEGYKELKATIIEQIATHGGVQCFRNRQMSFVDTTLFGSLLDWIPVLFDKEYEEKYIILSNINKESALFGKFAVYYRGNNSRVLFFVIHTINSAEELSNKLQSFNGQKSRILAMIQDFNFSTFYGYSYLF